MDKHDIKMRATVAMERGRREALLIQIEDALKGCTNGELEELLSHIKEWQHL